MCNMTWRTEDCEMSFVQQAVSVISVHSVACMRGILMVQKLFGRKTFCGSSRA